MSQKQLGEEEKIFVVSVDPTLRYSLDLYVVADANIAQECATEDAMEDIDLNVEVIELTLEDMQGGRRQ